MVCGCWIIASTAWLWQPALFWHVCKCVQTKEALSREVARTRLPLPVKAVFGITFLSFGISCHAQNWSHNGQPVSLLKGIRKLIGWVPEWVTWHCQAISILKKKEKNMFNIFWYDQPYSKFAQMIPNQSLLHEGFMIFWDYWINTTASCMCMRIHGVIQTAYM